MGGSFSIFELCPSCFRHLKGEDISSLNYKELMVLEDALESGLMSLRDKQACVISTPYLYVDPVFLFIC